MDDHGVSLGVPSAANPHAVGDKQQTNQQKKQNGERKKKHDKKRSAGSQDLAIISGETLKPKKNQESKDDEPSGKGDIIDIQV